MCDGDCPSEELLHEIVLLLLRENVLSVDALLNRAGQLDRRAQGNVSINESEKLSDLANDLKALAFLKDAPEPSDIQADRRRAKFRVIESDPSSV